MYQTRDNAWMTVGDYSSQAMSLNNIYFIADTEFMIEQVQCKVGKNGGTLVNVIWRVAGISEESNQAVQGFFDQNWDARMQRLEDTYRTRLTRKE